MVLRILGRLLCYNFASEASKILVYVYTYIYMNAICKDIVPHKKENHNKHITDSSQTQIDMIRPTRILATYLQHASVKIKTVACAVSP